MPSIKHSCQAFLIFLALSTGSPRSLIAAEEQYVLWGDARKGHKVFLEKGCGSCHPIRGIGPTLAPDLGRNPEKHPTMTQMAGAMWNHAPAMRKLAAEKGFIWKPFHGSEMRDLIAFLYAMSLMDEPGNPRRGERLFVEKGCATCHSIVGKTGKIGPDLTRWQRYGSPVLWAELMWAHAGRMEEKAREFGLRWPRFEGNELVDLIAYIQRELTQGTPKR